MASNPQFFQERPRSTISRHDQNRFDEVRQKKLNFLGQHVNIVQIGLGTNSTFIQNLKGTWDEWNRSIQWLMDACTETDPERIKGVAVEPVKEHVEALRGQATKLPGVDLVQAAISDEDTISELQVVTKAACEEALRQVHRRHRSRLRDKCEYLLNMSHFADREMMDFNRWHGEIADTFGVKVSLGTQRCIVWTWETLVRKFNFSGCEVLIIDTEGADVKILSSMITYCLQHPSEWPVVIQFETMGHCTAAAEQRATEELQGHGYALLGAGWYNTQLVRKDMLQSPHIQRWLEEWRCHRCQKPMRFPYVCSSEDGEECCPSCG